MTGAGPLPTSPLPAPAEDTYAVLRQRDFRLYVVGRFIASLGQQMLTVAVGWELYERTGLALALGLVGLAQMGPMLLLILPAGHVADSSNRKHVILWMLVVVALASVGLATISATHGAVYWVYLCLVAIGTARTFLWPASAAFLPQLVPRHQFARAVTWNTGAFHLSSVVGPAAGGALIALTHHATTVYVINAVASLVCVGLILPIRARAVVALQERMTLVSLVAGFKFVHATKIIFGTLTLDLFAVLLGGATALLPVYAKDILRAGPSGLGLLQAALPLGSLLSSLILAHRPPLEKAGRALLWSVAAFGGATIAFGFSTSFAFSFVMLFVCGLTDNLSVVVRHTLVQVLTPEAMRGRVSAVNSLFIGTSNELGGFESGFVAHLCGPVFAVVSGGVGTLVVVAAVALLWPEIRRIRRLDTPT